MSGQSGRRKRHSILERFHKRTSSTEKRESGGSNGSHLSGVQEEAEGTEDGSVAAEAEAEANSKRRIFFNMQLPDDARDQNGYPLTQFERNKIRTARYTPLSFIPKNLWFQFHNVANVYFLFILILSVSHTDSIPERHGASDTGFSSSRISAQQILVYRPYR